MGRFEYEKLEVSIILYDSVFQNSIIYYTITCPVHKVLRREKVPQKCYNEWVSKFICALLFSLIALALLDKFYIKEGKENQCIQPNQQEIVATTTVKYFEGSLSEWLEKLEQCESGKNPLAVGDNGRARGVFQFHFPTFSAFMIKYALAEESMLPSLYTDTWVQRQLTERIIREEPEGWRHWTNCSLKIGIPRNDIL